MNIGIHINIKESISLTDYIATDYHILFYKNHYGFMQVETICLYVSKSLYSLLKCVSLPLGSSLYR